MRVLRVLLLVLTLPALAGTRLVPAFAQHVSGANHSIWQSELRFYNPTGQPAIVTVANIFPYGASTCTGFAPITIDPGHLAQVRDAGCGDGGAAALELSCDDAIEITSVITNAGFMQPIPVFSVNAYRTTQTIANIQVPGVTPSSALGRNNLGLVNPGSAPLTVTLNYYGPDGEPEPLFRYTAVTLAPRSLTQLNDAFAQLPTNLTDPPAINGYFRVEASASGAFYLYDSYVDNATNDATFYGSNPTR